MNKNAEEKKPDVMIPNSTALATRQAPGGLAIPEELAGFTGLEGLDPGSMMIIPRIKIVQPTSKEGTEGKLRVNLTGDEFDDLAIVVVKAFQGRTFWDPDPKSDKVLCRSYDFMNPDPAIEKPYNDVCAVHTTNAKNQKVLKVLCPEGQWKGATHQEKPSCGEIINLLCIQSEDLLPFWISMSGASLRPVRNYVSAIALRRQALWVWKTVLSLEKRIEPNKHYVAKFSPPRPVEKDMFEMINATIIDLNLKDADIKKTFEAEEAAGADGNGDGTGEGQPDAPDWLDKK
ncbi:MAG: hypothetical protein ACLQBD_11465 [Syntrophobacteraceae bacterium]